MGAYAPLSARLLRKRCIDHATGCWLWTGAKNAAGYGNIGGERGAPRNINVHRAAYAQFVGPIPAGMVVMHRCDTPACFNPQHLALGTPRDNTLDMIAKGRDTRPSRTATHCKRGHQIDGRQSNGRRICKTCQRASYARYRDRKAAERAA